MPPIALLGAAAVADTVGGAIGAGQEKDAATAQQSAAIRAARVSPAEIRQNEINLENQEKTLARERELIAAVDPALIEAGKQAFQLLQGQDARILAPAKRQRARAREELRETLRNQLGPGFETSSAGIEALSRFDTQTSDLVAGQQQNAIDSLLGTAQRTRQLGQQGEQSAFNLGIQNAQVLGQQKSRELEAILGTSQQVTETAGGVAKAVGGGVASLGRLGSFSQLGGFSQVNRQQKILSGGNSGGGLGGNPGSQPGLA